MADGRRGQGGGGGGCRGTYCSRALVLRVGSSGRKFLYSSTSFSRDSSWLCSLLRRAGSDSRMWLVSCCRREVRDQKGWHGQDTREWQTHSPNQGPTPGCHYAATTPHSLERQQQINQATDTLMSGKGDGTEPPMSVRGYKQPTGPTSGTGHIHALEDKQQLARTVHPDHGNEGQ